MSMWMDMVMRRLTPLSAEPCNTWEQIRKQWLFTGQCIDYKEDGIEFPDCQLCGHEKIRYGYLIKNEQTNNTLSIGSVCIRKFGLAELLQLKQAVKKYKREKAERIENERAIRRFQSLSHVHDSFREYYNKHGAFTPRQAAFVFRILNENGAQFRRSDFRIRLHFKREWCQLYECYDQIIDCLTPKQKELAVCFLEGPMQ